MALLPAVFVWLTVVCSLKGGQGSHVWRLTQETPAALKINVCRLLWDYSPFFMLMASSFFRTVKNVTGNVCFQAHIWILDNIWRIRSELFSLLCHSNCDCRCHTCSHMGRLSAWSVEHTGGTTTHRKWKSVLCLQYVEASQVTWLEMMGYLYDPRETQYKQKAWQILPFYAFQTFHFAPQEWLFTSTGSQWREFNNWNDCVNHFSN